MAITIGINGFGRIGRVAFRIAINQPEKFKICGINVRNADLDYMIYMIRYDSIFGRFQGSLEKLGWNCCKWREDPSVFRK